jgi:SAM-dependent methyltransferase
MGYGLPANKAIWERQYRRGEWEFLNSPQELEHYEAIVAFLRAAGPAARVLDVGCGHGRLLQLLSGAAFGRYMGVDISTVAIEKARALGIPRADFAVADFQVWQPEDPFDVIVFNESLYYALRPLEVAKRFCKCLAANGRMVVSQVDYGDNEVIWEKLATHFTVCEDHTVTNAFGQRWKIKLLAERLQS